MAWTTPKTWIAGAVLPASDLNTHLRDQLLELRSGGIAVASQAQYDFVTAASPTQLQRLAAVAKKVPRFNAAGNAWEMVYPGAGIHELFVPIAAFRAKASGGCGALEDVLLSTGRYVQGCPFDPSTLEGASFTIGFPKSWGRGTITAQPYWMHTAGGSGGVVWSFAGVAAGDGETLDVAVGTAVTSTDSAQTAEMLCIGPETAAITIGGTPAIADLLRLEVERTPAAGGDTYASDAYLLGVKFRLTTDNADDE